MSYDAEKASAAAAFSEETVRRGFIKKVELFRSNSFADTAFSLRSTPYFLFNSWSPLTLDYLGKGNFFL